MSNSTRYPYRNPKYVLRKISSNYLLVATEFIRTGVSEPRQVQSRSTIIEAAEAEASIRDSWTEPRRRRKRGKAWAGIVRGETEDAL